MANFSLTSATNLFKINYFKKSENMYNSANVLQARVKKRYDFTGKQRFVATPLSFQGGVGSGSLPTANTANYGDAIILSKKVYSVVQVDREAIKASEDDKGAFVRATKEVVEKGVESYMRNCSRILFGDGSGILGRGAGATNVSGAGTTGSPYVVKISAASWKDANWEEKDFVQVVSGMNVSNNLGGSAEASLLEIVAVDTTNLLVSLVGTSAALAALTGVGPLPATSGLAMQNSYLQDPSGLKGVIIAPGSSTYNIPAQRRWSSVVNDAAGAGLTPSRMNSTILDVEKKFGRVPNLIITSYTQMKKLLDQLENQKRYSIDPRAKNLVGKISFDAIEFMSSAGAIPVVADRFCEDDVMYFLNDNFLEVHHRPDFGWFEDDGTVFLRDVNSDSYSARYGGYYENFITPTAHAALINLAK